ncbi:MAG: lipocalin-like domain-containing protein [Thiohalorhabdus sp.]|uniref:lipocalin-like domain-containing protein n=1 Tax=Thiohalorhabdus sp. TaxID=3094134 RepID=UPI002FC2D1FD
MKRRALLRLVGALPLIAAPGLRAAEKRAYARVTPERPLRLPADHAAHPDYATEWWYFTGFLELAGGGERTFEVTFFRQRPEPGDWLANPSAFTPRQIVTAHAALADPAGETFRHWRRLARIGLDGGRAASDRLDVGIRDWGLSAEGQGDWRLRLGGAPGEWDLRLRPTGDAVRHGEGGISPKDPAGKSASYYYTYPAMAVTGRLPEGEGKGEAWFDHEWTSTFLPQGTAGWDWVGLRFDDGGALMAYRFRDAEGATVYRAGTRIAPDRSTEPLSGDALAWEPVRTWTSPATGHTYLVAWDLRVRDERLRVDALFDAQEMVGTSAFSPTYWEGAVAVSGARGGRGFLEMTRLG